MDTKPFSLIAPCGFPDLKMAQLSDFNVKSTLEQSGKEIALIINKKLNVHYEQNNKY
jgi:lipoate-protein ligase B